MPIKKRRLSALLLKTGQTTSYGSGTGVDDGAYQKGVAKSYTILTAGQYAGTTNITLNGKTDAHSNECVLDNNTGLMWSRYVAGSVGPSSNGTLPWTTNANGEGIFTYAAAANAAGLAGYSDWRVPKDLDLASIRDMEAASGIPDATAFSSFPGNNNIFTATTCPSLTTYAMNYYSLQGVINAVVKTAACYLILVRGGG
jgi:hypothetical protein